MYGSRQVCTSDYPCLFEITLCTCPIIPCFLYLFLQVAVWRTLLTLTLILSAAHHILMALLSPLSKIAAMCAWQTRFVSYSRMLHTLPQIPPIAGLFKVILVEPIREVTEIFWRDGQLVSLANTQHTHSHCLSLTHTHTIAHATCGGVRVYASTL